KMSRRVNKTGRRRTVKAAPEERLERDCPHLAFIDPTRYDCVVRLLDQRNARHRRKGTNGLDSRKNVPKIRTVLPGQHLRCGVCGRLYYWTGTAAKKHLACSGSQAYKCWNSLALNGDLVAQRLCEAIRAEIQALPDFDACFLEMVRKHWEAARGAET